MTSDTLDKAVMILGTLVCIGMLIARYAL